MATRQAIAQRPLLLEPKNPADLRVSTDRRARRRARRRRRSARDSQPTAHGAQATARQPRSDARTNDGAMSRMRSAAVSIAIGPAAILLAPSWTFAISPSKGPIGLGKTALAERLGARLDATVVLDDADESVSWRTSTRAAAGAAFQAQLFFTLARHRQLLDLRQGDCSARPRSATTCSNATASTRS